MKSFRGREIVRKGFLYTETLSFEIELLLSNCWVGGLAAYCTYICLISGDD
jgi:hypothetical protein